MYDILPSPLLRTIRDRYIAGVADAEAEFDASSADEDSLTGALGQSISTKGIQYFGFEDRIYKWQISYKKIRGRGAGAPEKTLGADGVFQIEVWDSAGNSLRKKGLPFQCKKGWRGTDKKLSKQAADMLAATGHGIVIDYTSSGYSSCNARKVVEVAGSRRDLAKGDGMQPLGQLLGNDFLECREGRVGLFYNPEAELFSFGDVDLHLISTEVAAYYWE